MEGGALFNPGFLGGSFLWWVGQIADDSTWRDNILPGKFKNPKDIVGWGRRYKVRIIGLHDQEEETVPSDQLPWAQVMYPITAGGGQTNAAATPQLRQGNFVFGFFLDGQDQQVPVIMGVLGNNAQTALKGKTGMTGAKNFEPQRGYAKTKVPKGPANEKVPDEGLQTIKKADGPTKENADAVHEMHVGDVKRQDKYEEKVPLMKPKAKAETAIKGIKSSLENFLKKLKIYANRRSNYLDGLRNVITESGENPISKLITDTAKEITKYEKVVYYEIMEFTTKKLQVSLTPVVSALPSSLRFQFADVKEKLTENILCEYQAITEALYPKNIAMLNSMVPTPSSENSAPRAPVCSVEDLLGKSISNNRQRIDKLNDSLVKNVNTFVEDVAKEMAGVVEEEETPIKVPEIVADLIEAFEFTNLKLKILPCEFDEEDPVSDFYTLGRGGSGQPEIEFPSFRNLGEIAVAALAQDLPFQEEPPFAEPRKDKTQVNLDPGADNEDVRGSLELF
jgi:hypothetical protein